MEGKKKYLALVIFLFLGMITYTFANPNEELGDKNKAESNFTDYSNTEYRKTEAEKAVEEAEEDPTIENIEEALTAIEETVENEEVRQNLNQRVEQAEQAIDVAALVFNVESMINTAENTQDIQNSKNYYNNNNVEQHANNMVNGNVKDNIQKRINYINEVFADTTVPEITGIENGTTTKENVKLTIKDDIEYEVEVTLNNEKIDFAEEFNKEGIYEVNVVDDATNQNTLTFTVDKTKPTFENIKSGVHVNEYVVDVTDLTETTITLQKDHGEFTEILEGYNVTEEGTYQLVATDKAGNKTTLWFAIDKTKPTITGITNNSYVNKCDKAYVADKYLTEVIIDGKKYTRDDFEHDAHNENFKFELKICNEGTHKIVAKDKFGNVYEETFTIDKTNPKFENLPSREAHLDSYIVDVTDATKTIITLQKDHAEFVEIQEGYDITEEGTYQLVGVDAAGNKYTTWIIIDKTRPTITGVTNNSYVNKCDTAYVADRYLTEVIIDGKKYTRTDFTHNTKNEDFKFELRICNEGTHTITAKDKIGHVYEETFTIDKKAPTISFNGNVTGANKNIFYLEKGANTGVVKITANVEDKVDGASKLSPYKLSFKHAHDNETLDEENAKLDSSREGTYTYYYKVTDRAGNTTEKELHVIVQDTNELKVLSNNINYDEQTGTAIAVIVTNKDLNAVTNGWTQSLSKLNVITKKFYTNEKEEVTVKDLSGNELTITVEVTEISELHTKNEVVLEENTTLDKLLTIGENKNKVIDLNGYSLLVENPEDNQNALIQNNGTLTIKNGTVVNENPSTLGIIENNSTGEIILEDITFNDNGSKSGNTIINNGGKVTITDCEFNQTPTEKTNSKRYANAAIYHTDGELVVKNTKITGQSDVAYGIGINAGTVLLENLTIDHTRGGLSIYGGDVTINNANIVIREGANGYYALYVPNVADSNITINGGKYDGHRAALYLQGVNGYNGKVNVTVNDGVFSHKHTKTQYKPLIISKAQETHEINVTLNGGTFKKQDVTSYLKEGYRQDLTTWKVSATSKIEDVKYLKEVIAKGGTYTLENDLDLKDESLKVAKGINLTINTNGKTITGASSNQGTASLFKVENGATLTLTGNGTITFRAYAPDTDWDPEGFPTYASNTIANSGTLVIDGPTLINSTPRGGASYVIDNYAGGNLTVENGTIKQDGGDMAIRLNTASSTLENNVTINNATISGYRAFWIHLAGSNTSVAPVVNLTINNGKFETTQENGFALYSYSYGNSFVNTTATFNGGTFSGYVAFGGGYKKDKETVNVNGGTFNQGIGRYVLTSEHPDGWIDLGN